MIFARLGSASANCTNTQLARTIRTAASPICALAAVTRPSTSCLISAAMAAANASLSAKWLKKLPLATPAASTMSFTGIASMGRIASRSAPARNSADRVFRRRGSCGLWAGWLMRLPDGLNLGA